MEQLKLTQHELEAIGFKGQYVPADQEQETISSIWYTMPVANGEFLYNADTTPYKWYFRSSDTNVSNLIIHVVEELYVLLQCFVADFNILGDDSIEYDEE